MTIELFSRLIKYILDISQHAQSTVVIVPSESCYLHALDWNQISNYVVCFLFDVRGYFSDQF